MNNTTFTSIDFKRIGYLTFGSFTLIINSLTLVTFFYNKTLLKKSVVNIAISLANLSISLYLTINGIYRLTIGQSEYASKLIPAYQCVLMLFPLFHPIAFFSEGIFIVIGSLERYLAVTKPFWFHKAWTNQLAWKIVAAGFLILFLIVSIGVYISFHLPPINLTCSIPSVFGKWFVFICHTISGLGGAGGAVLSIFALINGLKRLRKLPLISGEVGRMRRQIQLSKSMCMVSLSDFCFVGLPNILDNIDTIVNNPTLHNIKQILINYAFCINVLFSFMAFMIFNREFRKCAVKLLRIEKVGTFLSTRYGNQVHPITVL